MFKCIIKYCFFLIVLLCTISYNCLSANYYWRSNPIDNLFTNVGNWETSPGSGLSPSLAPSVNDDVFFPVSSTISTINLNSGNCRDFNVTALLPATFLFNGALTAINGSLNCPNGNATFNFSGIQNFIGSGSHVINMGTSDVRLNGLMAFSNGTGTGSYSQIGTLNVNGVLTFSSQSYTTNGYDLSAYQINITGSSIRNIDMSNSLITINKQGLFGAIQFLSSHTTTNYNLTGTHIVINDSSTTRLASLLINPGVHLSFDTLTINKTNTTSNTSTISVIGSTGSTAIITMNVLRINIANLTLGAINFDNTLSSLSQCILNIGNLIFMRRSTITADRHFTLNIGALTESSVCQGQSAIVSVGYAPIFINPTTPISTTNIAYYGVSFGGSGITTSASNDLGNNSGSVTWGATITGINYWWVGGNGNWNDPTKWSILGSGGAPQTSSGCLPTIYDDVIFDANSFTGAQSVTIGDGDAFCNTINWSGSNLGLLTGGVLHGGDIFLGNLFIKGDADFTGARGIGANLMFVGSASNTITSGGFFSYSSPAIKIMGTGSRTLADDVIASSATSYLQHTAGTFNTAGFTVDVANFCSRSFPEIASNPRTLTIANSDINIRSFVNSVISGRRHIDVSFLSALNAANSNIIIHSTDPSSNFLVTKGNASATYLSIINLNNISFVGTSGKPLLMTNALGGGGYTINFNELNFSSSAFINSISTVTHNVNNYNLTSGSTYTFAHSAGSGPTFNVIGNINHVVSGCQELVRIESLVPGTRTRVNKSVGPFNVDGAIVVDINSVGATMNINNGVDAGNNVNVSVSAATSRTMYWVNNAGNWSDGIGHWSIATSGGDPIMTNPFGCVPRIVDDVVFDANSFSISGQAVQLNIDGNCRNMLWTTSAGSDAPVFAGASIRRLNLYGSIELGSGMTSSFSGRVYMMGTTTTALAHTIDMNGVSTNNSFWMSGGGRYDLVDSVRIISSDQGIRLERGNFVTNGHRIYASAMVLDVSGSNAADIANSYIRLFAIGNLGIISSSTYIATHSSTGSWNATGSTIHIDGNNLVISNNNPVVYNNVIMNSANTNGISGSATQPVTFNKIEWLQVPSFASGGSRMDGVFVIDTLIYPISSLNTFQAGASRSYTINDTLIAFGTPCNPTFLRSASSGLQAPIASSSCNFDFNFVNLRDINAISCSASQNKSIGTDEGGNNNWTITSIPGLTKLGDDTGIVCGGPMLTLDAIGFGKIPGILYNWNNGSTARTINVNTADTYSVVVTYGVGCIVSDSIVVSCASILPLNSLHLKGRIVQSEADLEWSVLTTNKVSYYWVDKSSDGLHYMTLDTVWVNEHNAGNSNFNVHDSSPHIGGNFYRIRQVNTQNETRYSNVLYLFNDEKEVQSFQVFPNPITNKFEVRFATKGPYQLVIRNALGLVVWSTRVNVLQDDAVVKFDINDYLSGTYILTISSEDNKINENIKINIH